MILVAPLFIRPGEIRKTLRNRQCSFVHANTPETSLSFLSNGILFSRNRASELSLPQTAQYTDSTDEQFGILDSVFIDLCDLHRCFKKPNKYGPVSFNVNVERLLLFLENSQANVSITNAAPHTWKHTDTAEQRWLKEDAINGLFPNPANNSSNSGFIKGWPSLVINNLGTSGVPLSIVDEVVVDNPPSGLVDYNSFLTVAKSFGATVKIRERTPGDCAVGCICREAHGYNGVATERLSLGAWSPERKTG